MTTYEAHRQCSPADLSHFLDDNLEHFNAVELVTFIELIGCENYMFDYVMRWSEVDEEAEVTETDTEIRVAAHAGDDPFIVFTE